MSGRAGVVTGVGVIVALLAAGCGSGAKAEAKPAIVVSAAADKTTSGTAQISGITSVEGGGERLVIQRFTGKQDFDAQTSAMAMRSPLDPTDESSDEIVIDLIAQPDAGYERISDLELPGGKEWIKIVPGDAGLPRTDGQSLGSQDPADGLQFLEGIRNAHLVGPAEVRGESTTRYGVTIDLVRLMDLVAKGAKKLSPEFAKGLQTLQDRVDLSRLPGDVWLDDAGRVRRFTYAIPVKVRGQTIRTISTLEYFDFGTPVSIDAPPESDTVSFADAQDLMREYLRGLASDEPTRSAA